MTVTLANNIVTITSVTATGYYFVHYIQQVLTTGVSTIHNVITATSSIKTLPADGYYQVSEIKLPSTPGAYYYTDGTLLYNPSGVVISFADLLALDPVVAGLTRTDQNIFSYYEVNTFYINSIKNKFLNNCCCSQSDNALIDYLTMGLTLIPNLISLSYYYEAQRIVELLDRCSSSTPISCNCNG